MKGDVCSGGSECPEGGSRDGQNCHLVEVAESHQVFNTEVPSIIHAAIMRCHTTAQIQL